MSGPAKNLKHEEVGLLGVGEARILGPFEEAEGLRRGFDAAEGLEEGCLGEGGDGGEAGFESGRPGVGVNKASRRSGFLALVAICNLNLAACFIWDGFGGGGFGK